MTYSRPVSEEALALHHESIVIDATSFFCEGHTELLSTAGVTALNMTVPDIEDDVGEATKAIAEHYALNDKGRGVFVNMKKALETAVHRIKKFRIKGTPASHVESLSGGNQQRLLLSFLPRKPKLLLLENPTRGLDLESAHWVWEHLQKFCTRDHTSLVFTSPELDEILMVADRVLVFYDGRVIKDVRTDEIDVNELGRAIAGKC